jgi:hypothetical protein
MLHYPIHDGNLREEGGGAPPQRSGAPSDFGSPS